MRNSSLFLLSSAIVILLLSGWMAFIIRHRQLHKLKRQVEELEKEMLNNHRELLKLETELAKRLIVPVRSRE